MRGQGQRAVAEDLLEDDAFAAELIEMRCGALRVAVQGETIGPECVDGDEDDGRAWIRAEAVRAAYGEEYSGNEDR
jgi:hypothetical protein